MYWSRVGSVGPKQWVCGNGGDWDGHMDEETQGVRASLEK